jgi:undecaprenyl-diphosphatase
LAFFYYASWWIAYVSIHFLKNAVDRSRPVFDDPIAIIQSPSFPSGHAGDTMVVFGLLAYLLSRSWPNWKWFSVTACGLFILAMGFSRVYLGVHWLTDVAGGFLLGMGINLLAITAIELSCPAGAPHHVERFSRSTTGSARSLASTPAVGR